MHGHHRLNLDQPTYIVIGAHPQGGFIAEQDFANAHTVEAAIGIVQDLDYDVLHVLCCNPVENTCRDVTAEIAQAMADKLSMDGQAPTALQARFLDREGAEYLDEDDLSAMHRQHVADQRALMPGVL